MRIPNWYRVESNGIRFCQAWNLHASGLVRHGFSTRTGGVSPAPFGALNVGFGTDDARENVAATARRAEWGPGCVWYECRSTLRRNCTDMYLP